MSRLAESLGDMFDPAFSAPLCEFQRRPEAPLFAAATVPTTPEKDISGEIDDLIEVQR